MTDGVQSLVTTTLLAVCVSVPLLVMSKLYRQPSPVYQEPWRAIAWLIALAIASPVAGYYLTEAIAMVMDRGGWHFLDTDPGFPLTVFLLVAAASLFSANLAIVLTLVMRRARTGGKIAPQ